MTIVNGKEAEMASGEYRNMDIRSSFDGLKSILGVANSPAATPQTRTDSVATTGSTVWGSDQATLSSAGSAVSSTTSNSDVRMDKVAAIQAALAAGTYQVSATAVASRVVDSMMAVQ